MKCALCTLRAGRCRHLWFGDGFGSSAASPPYSTPCPATGLGGLCGQQDPRVRGAGVASGLCWNWASGNVLLVLLWWGQGPTELSSLLLVLVLQSPCVGHAGSVKPSNSVLLASLSILCGIYPSKRLRAGSTRHRGAVSSGLLSAPGCSPAQLFS